MLKRVFACILAASVVEAIKVSDPTVQSVPWCTSLGCNKNSAAPYAVDDFGNPIDASLPPADYKGPGPFHGKLDQDILDTQEHYRNAKLTVKK